MQLLRATVRCAESCARLRNETHINPEPPIAKAKCDMNWNDEGEWLEGNADRVGEDV